MNAVAHPSWVGSGYQCSKIYGVLKLLLELTLPSKFQWWVVLLFNEKSTVPVFHFFIINFGSHSGFTLEINGNW